MALGRTAGVSGRHAPHIPERTVAHRGLETPSIGDIRRFSSPMAMPCIGDWRRVRRGCSAVAPKALFI